MKQRTANKYLRLSCTVVLKHLIASLTVNAYLNMKFIILPNQEKFYQP